MPRIVCFTLELQWQQRVPPERDDDGLLPDRQHRGFGILRPGRQIGNRGPPAPLGHGLLVRRENDPLDRFLTLLTPVTRRQRPQSRLTILNCPPLGASRRMQSFACRPTDCCAITCRATDGLPQSSWPIAGIFIH